LLNLITDNKKTKKRRLLAKTRIVILQQAKNLMFLFSGQKNQKGDPFALHPQDDTEK
jgi:hypothetical protein